MHNLAIQSDTVKAILLSTLFCYFFFNHSFAGNEVSDSLLKSSSSHITNDPDRLVGHLVNSYEKNEKFLVRKSEKWIKRLKRYERALQKRIEKNGVDISKQLPQSNNNFYSKIQQQVVSASPVSSSGVYIPQIDSLTVLTDYFHQSVKNGRMQNIPTPGKIKELSGKLKSALNNLQGAASIQQQLNERKAQLRKIAEVSGINKEFRKYQEQYYYYQRQVNEYKSALENPDKAFKKLMSYVRDIPEFKAFLRKNSQLSRLFLPPDPLSGTVSLVPGLQTQSGVQALIGQRFSGADPLGMMQQQTDLAKEQLNELKEKVRKVSGDQNESDMPDFKPNGQKIKSFFRRLEYGMNIQSAKRNNLLPVTTDWAFSLGYKLNDKSTIGIGAAYKMGWGDGFQRIQITNEGIGLRSFVEMKLKGSIWISGGYEQNYWARFGRISQLGAIKWQESGLIGISKKYRLVKKTGNLQLLWDFLNRQTGPALQFRTGFSL